MILAKHPHHLEINCHPLPTFICPNSSDYVKFFNYLTSKVDQFFFYWNLHPRTDPRPMMYYEAPYTVSDVIKTMARYGPLFFNGAWVAVWPILIRKSFFSDWSFELFYQLHTMSLFSVQLVLQWWLLWTKDHDKTEGLYKMQFYVAKFT